MSIYCTTFDLGMEHSRKCKRICKVSRGVYEQDDRKPCTCDSTPIQYDHSGVLPSNRDKRAGSFSLGAIPSHITRNGRDDAPEGQWHPWLRVSINSRKGTVILTRKQVQKLKDALESWLEASK